MPLSNELIYNSTPTSGFAVGDLIYSKSGSVTSGIADVATGNALISGGVTTAPAWGKITSSHVDSSISTQSGFTWVARAAAEANAWQSVAYGNGVFVAVSAAGTNQVMTSPDGVTWAERSAASGSWAEVTFGNGLFVVVGGTGTNRVMTSPDGITWTARTEAEANSWAGIAFGNNLFVAVSAAGTNRVMTSPDGITWTSQSASENNFWQNVTYGNGLFVAVSSNGTNQVMTSPDGITWTSRSASAVSGWWAVTYGNGIFVAVSFNGLVMSSPDGETWTSRTIDANAWNSVTYGDGIFVTVASSGTNRVATSPDGINWTGRSASEANSWWDVAYGNGIFVSVSTNGTNRVMTSGVKLEHTLYQNNSTGIGPRVRQTSPTLVTPLLGTPASGVLTNCTGTAAGLTAGNVTTNANLTGPITSVGNATSIASQTGTGTKFVVDTSPTLVTPILGVASATSLTLSGNQSSAAWTTNGIRIVGTSGTLTDTSSSGTVATAYTNKLGGNTIAASSATTFTNYVGSYFSDTIAGTNVTLTNKWALGADSIRVGTSNHFTVTNAGVVSANTLGVGIATPDGTLHVNRGSAGSVASSAYATITQESSDGTANDFQYLSPNTAQQRILFGDVDDNDVGMIRYIHSNNSLDIITNTAVAVYINSTQDVGIGASAATAQKLLVSKTNAANTTGIGIKSTLISSATSNGSYYGIALDFDLSNMSISTSITDSGYRAGVRGDAYAGTANFLGTLAAQYGVWGRAGISVCGTGGTVTNACGLRSEILNDHASGTITNAYGLYIDNFRTTGTITNRWGVYVDTGSAGKNYFSAQVGIGTSSPNANAILDLTSTTKAFMLPRMTTTQRDAISSPAEGMYVHNTTTKVLNFHNGTSWGAV